MFDVLDESLIPLAVAAREIPNRKGGLGVDVATVWRWTLKGIKGIRLESVMAGGIRQTSREAIRRFFERLTAAADGASVAVIRTSKQRERAIAAAERELATT